MFTPIGDILDYLETFVGTQISVSGQLLVGEEDRSFVATNYLAYKEGKLLPVVDGKRIATHLFRALPAYVGGDVIYDESAYLTGTVKRRPGGYELGDLRVCRVVRDDIELTIPLDSAGDAAAR